MGKAVKAVANPIKKVVQVANPISYFGSKGLVDVLRGKNPISSAQQDVADTWRMSSPEDRALMEKAAAEERMNQFLGDVGSQASADQRDITGFGEKEYARAGETNAEIMNMRKARRAELASLLAKQADEEFQLSKPELAEEANAAGILYSTGFGDRLAKQKLELARARENALAENALGDVEADIAGRREAETLGRGYRESGLSRRLSLEDFSREARLAKEIGASSAPSVKQGSKAGLLGGGTAGAGVGSAFGPMGAMIGGGAGAILGAGAQKGK